MFWAMATDVRSGKLEFLQLSHDLNLACCLFQNSGVRGLCTTVQLDLSKQLAKRLVSPFPAPSAAAKAI